MKKFLYLLAYEDGTEIVPRRRHIKFKRRGITQKKSIKYIPSCIRVVIQEIVS